MIDRARWDSDDPDDAVAGFVYSVTHECQAPDTAEAVIAEVKRCADRLTNDRRAALVREAMADPATVRDALALAEHYLKALAAHPREDPTVSICLVDGAIGSAITHAAALPWSRLARRLVWPEKWEGEKLSAPAWLPVRLIEGAPRVRKDCHVAGVSCLVLDIDDGVDLNTIRHKLAGMGLAAVLHTTWSHTPKQHKARIVFPFRVECPREEWAEVWAAADQWSRGWGAVIDPACKNPSRLYFLPALPAEHWDDMERSPLFDWRGEQYAGKVLHWRWLVAHHLPEPEPVVLPPVPSRPEWVGRPSGDLEKMQRRRALFARGVVDHRAGRIAGGPGRNTRSYSGARAAGQLVAAGAITEAEAGAILLHAALAAGLPEAEARRTIANGLETGKGDGPWDFSTLS